MGFLGSETYDEAERILKEENTRLGNEVANGKNIEDFSPQEQAIIKRDPTALLELTLDAGMDDTMTTIFVSANGVPKIPGRGAPYKEYNLGDNAVVKFGANNEFELYTGEERKTSVGGHNADGSKLITPITQVERVTSQTRPDKYLASKINDFTNNTVNAIIIHEVVNGKDATNQQIDNMISGMQERGLPDTIFMDDNIVPMQQKLADELVSRGYSQEESLAAVKFKIGEELSKAMMSKLEGRYSPEKIAEIGKAYQLRANKLRESIY